MVYVPGGSVTIKYSQSSTDTNSKKRVSLSSFYIDKTEVTNQQYRMFSEWVIDSIAIVNYLKDDKYFLDPPPGGYPDEKAKEAKAEIAKTDTVAVKDTLATALGGDIPVAPAASVTPTTSVAPTVASSDTNATKNSAVTDSTGRLVRRRINWSKVKHKDIFESDDDEIKAKIAPMYDPVTNRVREELYVYNFTYLKATGTNKNVKVGEYTTEPINIYPDTKIWFKDLHNSQVEILVENYFTQPPFDDYPVVGVSWKQARAFAAWRSHTNFDFANIAEYLKYYRLQFSLPSEAQWVYAAGKDIKNANQPVMTSEPEPEATPEKAPDTAVAAAPAPVLDSSVTAGTNVMPVADTTATVATDDNASKDGESKKKKKKKKKKGEEAEEEPAEVVVAAKDDKDATPVERDRNGALLVNFKQEEGDYTEDGANFTLPVMSYAPNEFGVYNMVGNVAEWVLDAYSPSAFAFVSDINPVLLYDADPKDADAMKRKVVRGGSFVSNAKALSPFTRDFELQDNVHCYIGFRCVMSAPEILSKYVATRRKETSSKKPAATDAKSDKSKSKTTTSTATPSNTKK
jgi:formylglycine-generating enzyme required for sulfatase activity